MPNVRWKTANPQPVVYGVRGQSVAATPLWLTRPSIGHRPPVCARSTCWPRLTRFRELQLRNPKRRVPRRSLQGEGRVVSGALPAHFPGLGAAGGTGAGAEPEAGAGERAGVAPVGVCSSLPSFS